MNVIIIIIIIIIFSSSRSSSSSIYAFKRISFAKSESVRLEFWLCVAENKIPIYSSPSLVNEGTFSIYSEIEQQKKKLNISFVKC